MSGIYALGVIALWLALNWGLWKAWRRSRRDAGKNQRRVDIVFGAFAIAWLAASFWYGGGRKFYYDAEVKEFCAIDGGVKIYEIVKLPSDRFNQWGEVSFYRADQGEAALGDEYITRLDRKYFRSENPVISRFHYEVIRRADHKKLGETTIYSRNGGDLYGPWAPSSFSCPPIVDSSEIVLFRNIFHIEGVSHE